MSGAADGALDLEREGPASLPVPGGQPLSDSPSPQERETAAFERLRALVRRGYAVDLDRAGPGGGLLLNHGGGPALLLMPDGTVESLQRSRAGGTKAQRIGTETEADRRSFANFLERLEPGRGARPRRWRKRLVVTFLILAVWLGSIMLTVMIGNM